MSLPLHTGFFSPYVAAAPYGLFFRPMSLPPHTGFWLRLLPGGQYAFAAALLPGGQYAQFL